MSTTVIDACVIVCYRKWQAVHKMLSEV